MNLFGWGQDFSLSNPVNGACFGIGSCLEHKACSSEKELADIFPFSPPASCHSGAMVSAVTTQRGGFGFKPARWGLSEWSLHVLDVPAWVLAFSHRHAKTCTFLQVGSTLECVQMCLFNVHFAQ